MTTRPESERDRDERHRQRTLFDGIAERYETSRPGYPTSVTEFVTTTANLHPGAEILEIGCGTGQLTENLAGHGFRLTAIDIGPSMIATARRLCLADEQRATLTASEVIALESTRATLLSWPPPHTAPFHRGTPPDSRAPAHRAPDPAHIRHDGYQVSAERRAAHPVMRAE